MTLGTLVPAGRMCCLHTSVNLVVGVCSSQTFSSYHAPCRHSIVAQTLFRGATSQTAQAPRSAVLFRAEHRRFCAHHFMNLLSKSPQVKHSRSKSLGNICSRPKANAPNTSMSGLSPRHLLLKGEVGASSSSETVRLLLDGDSEASGSSGRSNSAGNVRGSKKGLSPPRFLLEGDLGDSEASSASMSA